MRHAVRTGAATAALTRPGLGTPRYTVGACVRVGSRVARASTRQLPSPARPHRPSGVVVRRAGGRHRRRRQPTRARQTGHDGPQATLDAEEPVQVLHERPGLGSGGRTVWARPKRAQCCTTVGSAASTSHRAVAAHGPPAGDGGAGFPHPRAPGVHARGGEVVGSGTLASRTGPLGHRRAAVGGGCGGTHVPPAVAPVCHVPSQGSPATGEHHRSPPRLRSAQPVPEKARHDAVSDGPDPVPRPPPADHRSPGVPGCRGPPQPLALYTEPASVPGPRSQHTHLYTVARTRTARRLPAPAIRVRRAAPIHT